MGDTHAHVRSFIHEKTKWAEDDSKMDIALRVFVDQLGLSTTPTGLQTASALFKRQEEQDKHTTRQALVDAGLKLLQAQEVLDIFIAASAQAGTPTASNLVKGGKSGGIKGVSTSTSKEKESKNFRGGVAVVGMGRGIIPTIVNMQCERVVVEGLGWQAQEGGEGGLITKAGVWTVAGVGHMKEVVRKLVTHSEWKEVQVEVPNLNGISQEVLQSEPKEWPLAARMQLEAWMCKQIEAARRSQKLGKTMCLCSCVRVCVGVGVDVACYLRMNCFVHENKHTQLT